MFGFFGKPPQPAHGLSSNAPVRSCAVDFLRGVAILLVLGCHFAVAPNTAGFLEPLAAGWYRIGWAGVDLFFVLSGFLVSGLLFAEFKRTQRVDARRFLVRRGFKIWPAYFAYLAFVAAWLAWQHARGQAAGAPGLWPNLLHVQNYFGTPRIHTWSLAVEEHFYLAGAALASFFLVRLRFASVQRVFPLLAVASLLVVAVVRHTVFAAEGRGALNLFATHLRFDGLLVGSLVAYFAHFAPERLQWTRRYPVPCVLAGLALAVPELVLTPDHSAFTAGFGLTTMYVGFAVAMLGVLGLERGSGRERRIIAAAPVRAVARMGFFSYGIYLWHIDLAEVPMRKLGDLVAAHGFSGAFVWLGVTTLYVVLAALLGALMSRLIEIPCLALRDRFFPSRTVAVKPVRPEVAAPESAPAAAPVESRPVLVAGS